MQGSDVYVRTKDDIGKFYSLVNRSQNNAVCLWCDGLWLSKKRDYSDDDVLKNCIKLSPASYILRTSKSTFEFPIKTLISSCMHARRWPILS